MKKNPYLRYLYNDTPGIQTNIPGCLINLIAKYYYTDLFGVLIFIDRQFSN